MRPARGYPSRIDATAEKIAQVFMRAKPPSPAVDLEWEYRCVGCVRVVEWPEILYRHGRCEDCHKKALAV